MKLLKNFSVYSLGKILVEGLKFFLIPVYTKYIPLDQYGILNVLNSIKSFFIGFFSQISISSVDRFYFKDKDNKSFYSTLMFIFLIGFSLFLFISIIFYNFIYNSIFSPYPQFSYLYFILVFIGFFEFLITFKKLESTLESKSLEFVLISFVQGIGSLILTVYLVIFKKMTIDGIFLSLFLVYFLISIYIFIIRFNKIFCKPNFTLMKKYFTFGYPFSFGKMSNIFLQMGDRIVIKYILTNAAVGAYSFIYFISEGLNFILVEPFINVVRPIIMKNENNLKELQKIIHYSVISLSVAITYASLIFVFFAKYILTFLVHNSSYMQFYNITFVLSFGIIFRAVNRLFSRGLLFKNKSKHIMSITIVGGIVNLILNLMLLPLIGIMGAALATSVSYGLIMCLNLYYSEKYHPLNYPKKNFSLTILSYLFSLGLYFIFQSVINEILLKILIVIFFPVLLYFIGVINKRNIKFIFKTIIRN